MPRVWLEEPTGLARGRRFEAGGSHAFADVTDEPAPSVVASRVQKVAVTDEPPAPRTPASKPPYRVPSMAEVAERRGTNGYRMVSTFSGCGGSCLGFELAGFEVVWASEFVEAAAEVYRLNHPGVPVDGRDLRTVEAGDVLDATGLAVGELDVLEGSPPCSAFSRAGKRARGWGQRKAYSDTEQESVEDLFFEFVRLVDGLRPRVFVAENVAGLAQGVAKGYLIDIVGRMKALGYRTKVGALDAQWLGVPQRRPRLIFVGVRDDLGVEPRFPKPLPYRYSVVDACPWLLDQAPPEAAGAPDISRFAIGRAAAILPQGGHSKRYINLKRADAKEPSPTVTAIGGIPGAASVVHPTQLRKFSIAELRRICGFPDDFELTGTYTQQWERLGRAVPPVMAAAIAGEVAGLLAGVDGRA